MCYTVGSYYLFLNIAVYVYMSMSISKFILSPLFFLAGEGNEEISNMIHNYIKEIEDLRYSLYSAIYNAHIWVLQ